MPFGESSMENEPVGKDRGRTEIEVWVNHVCQVRGDIGLHVCMCLSVCVIVRVNIFG